MKALHMKQFIFAIRSVIPRLRRGAPLLAWSSALLALSVTACGSTSDTQATGSAGASSAAGSTGNDDVGKILDSPAPCTTPHTICVSAPIPADMTESPASLQFDIYDSSGPPSHPPDGLAGSFTSPRLTAGKMTYFELNDTGLQGDYWIWSIAYMPGGGHGRPVVGVDYLQVSAPPAIHLDGSPLNIAEPIMLQK